MSWAPWMIVCWLLGRIQSVLQVNISFRVTLMILLEFGVSLSRNDARLNARYVVMCLGHFLGQGGGLCRRILRHWICEDLDSALMG